jgi:hypothetical protein
VATTQEKEEEVCAQNAQAAQTCTCKQGEGQHWLSSKGSRLACFHSTGSIFGGNSRSALSQYKDTLYSKLTRHIESFLPVGAHTSMFSLLVKAVWKMRLWIRFNVL